MKRISIDNKRKGDKSSFTSSSLRIKAHNSGLVPAWRGVNFLHSFLLFWYTYLTFKPYLVDLQTLPQIPVSFVSLRLNFYFRVSVARVTDAIIDVLMPDYLTMPTQQMTLSFYILISFMTPQSLSILFLDNYFSTPMFNK